MGYVLRKALVTDVKDIHEALLGAAQQGLLLPRSLSALYSCCRDFTVMSDYDGKFMGCCALSIFWEDTAEIRSLLVLEAWRGQGLGRVLVEECLKEARRLQLSRVFTLTYQREFFNKLEFGEVEKEVLPQKIWADCLHCAKFPNCDEIAMVRQL